MEIDVRKRRNQRNKRRERAQRMQAERDRDSVDSAGSTTNVSNSGSGASRETGNGTSTPQNTPATITNTSAVHDSADEDMANAPPIREKPPPRRKKQKEQSPLLEEDIIDGFAILAFKTYEDLEYAIKLATKLNEKRLSSITELTTLEDKPIKLLDTGQRDKDRDKDRDCEREWNHKQHNHITNNHHQQSVVNHTSHNSLTIANDPGTSDDSGRASERLTTSSVAPRDADSSRDRLSDASSRCSSGKGYICDSEGDDDKGSDGGSVVFASTPAQVATTAPSPTVPRKTDFPSTGLPHSNGPLTLGGSASPVSNATSQSTPTTATTPTSSQTPQMQVSNGPINSSSPISPSQTAPSGLVKSIPAKVPSTSTSTSTSPGKPTQPQQSTSPTTHQNSQTQSQQASPLVTLSNGFAPSTIPPIASTTHSTPLITSPISHPSAITNGTTQSSASVIGSVPTQSPATLQAVAPAVHPSAENSTGRTNSPAVAPSANGTSNLTPSSNGGIPSPYRYPGYPLYAPYGSFHHASPYPVSAPIPPPTISSPSASPRTIDSKSSRDYPHVRRISPNSEKSVNSENSEKPVAPAPPLSSSLREQTSHSISKSQSPRGHSPSRDRDNYSSNVSSLSRTSTPNSGIAYPGPVSVSTGTISSVLPYNSLSSTIASSSSAAPPPNVAVTSSSLSSYPKLTASSWPSASSAQLSPAITNTITKPAPPQGSIASAPSLHSTVTTHSSFPPPLFATPLPPVSSAASVTTSAPHPFSAESLFQSSKADQADHLRRELDNRFLDRAGLTVVPSSPYLRQELHHHQHQHTHLHQHQHQQPPNPSLFPPPLFKDMPKFDSPFHRTGLGVTYPGYGPSILHPPGLGTPFVPPNHVTSFAPKQPQAHPAVESTKPKQVKPGRWNAMHVRIAWEILHHQKKENPDKTSTTPNLAKAAATPSEMHRPPSHIFSSANVLQRPPEMSTTFPPGLPRPYDTGSIPSGFLAAGPTSHLGNAVSPFGRYASPFNNFPSLTFGRDIPIGAPPTLHDPWRNPLPRAVAGYPPAWTFKPDPAIEALRLREAEEKERERKRREEEARREREEKERREKEKEERARKEQQEREQREQRERERERREKERRELERIERERMLQQQRLSESSKMQRERSPLRNGTDSDVSRIKEEPKREDEMMMRGPPNVVPDPRYAHAQHLAAQHYMVNRHMMQGQMPPLGRSILTHPMAGPPMSHFPPPPAGWPSPALDAYRDPYRLDPMHQLRYAPGVMEAYRADEERAKAMYAAHLRAKEPSPIPAPPNRLNPSVGSLKPSENAPAR